MDIDIFKVAKFMTKSCLDLFYGANTFTFSDLYHFETFCRTIKVHNLKRLTRVVLLAPSSNLIFKHPEAGNMPGSVRVCLTMGMSKLQLLHLGYIGKGVERTVLKPVKKRIFDTTLWNENAYQTIQPIATEHDMLKGGIVYCGKEKMCTTICAPGYNYVPGPDEVLVDINETKNSDKHWDQAKKRKERSFEKQLKHLQDSAALFGIPLDPRIANIPRKAAKKTAKKAKTQA